MKFFSFEIVEGSKKTSAHFKSGITIKFSLYKIFPKIQTKLNFPKA